MGAMISPAVFNTSGLNEEVAESLNQIIRAFNQEFPLESRRRKDNHQHHQSISTSSSTSREDSIKHSHARSHSADEYHAEEQQRTQQMKLSTIKRQWQCQLCHTVNEGGVLICSECGSNKINVYVPIIDRMDRDQGGRDPSAISSPAATLALTQY